MELQQAARHRRNFEYHFGGAEKGTGVHYRRAVQACRSLKEEELEAVEGDSAPAVSGIRAKLDSYFKGSQALVTTYTYSPFFGLTLKTDPNGNITHYNYDEFGRLKSVTGRLKKTVQNFEYHYKNQ